MIDASNRVEFQGPRMLVIEIPEPFPLRFHDVVRLTRVAVHHGGGVTLITDKGQFDAASAFSVIQALVMPPLAQRFAFTGPEPALRDLHRLCWLVWIDGRPDAVARELAYLR